MNFTIGHQQRILRACSRVKHPEWVGAAIVCLGIWLGGTLGANAVTAGAAVLEERMEATSSGPDHLSAVERLLVAFEAQRGGKVAPGETGRVGLKVYTNSGPGLSTPVDLVRGLIEALVARGFGRENVFILDRSLHQLRASGFVTELQEEGQYFEGHPVYVLESGKHYNDIWFYESPLPPRRESELASRPGRFSYEADVTDRYSYLPVPLLLEVDFWINLPVYSDHPVLGINGALVNATLWNSSNTTRFFQSESSGAAAVAEMAAIPELADGWLFSLVSLERYQFIGGPLFRSLYTATEPVLLLGADPVALDSRMYRRINDRRRERGFDEMEAGWTLLDYAAQLRLGRSEHSEGPYRRGGEREGSPEGGGE
jgi:hypothetical protein